MSDTKTLSFSKVVAIVAAVAMTAGVMFAMYAPSAHAALTEAQIQSILSLLQSFGADQSTINNVNASLRGQPTTGTTSSGSGVCPYTWTRSLSNGATGDDVMKLQMFLNDNGFTVSSSGAGSPGQESTYYGSKTGAAVKMYQEANASSVLAPVGLTSGTPFFGPSTRAYANSMCVSGTVTPPAGDDDGDVGFDDSTPPATGTGLNVSGAVQPANAVIPKSAARVPFTKFYVTAGSDGAVNMNSVTVKRTALGANADFSGVVLLDENGLQVGTAKTLNSNDQATVGTTVSIPAGQTKMFTIAGNIAASPTANDQLALDVVGVNTSAVVSGTFPIKGATHSVNASFSIGSVTMTRGANDPGAAQTKNVGETGYTFSSIKVTTGSVEDVYIKSLRWNQSGSANKDDLENVKTVVDGTEYEVIVNGDDYTTTFAGDGLLVETGFSKDISIRGDLKGGSGRTVAFDMAKIADLYVVGKTYGFGITAPQTDTCGAATGVACFTSGEDPWYDGAIVTVSAGTMNVSSWTQISAQNVAENVLNQPIAGFAVDVRGEPITVGTIKMVVNINSTTAAVGTADLTNLVLVDQNGSILAGPKDGSNATADNETISFSDSVTFPVGITNITLKGKLGTDFANNDTVMASTTASGWTTVTGDVTGKSITPTPASALNGPTMTLKAGSVTVSVSSVPLAQTVIAGAQQFLFANYIFDSTSSGEDVRVTSVPVVYGGDGSATANLTSGCQMYDGTTSVTTGSNVVNPTAFSSSTTFTFDGTGVILPKGTSKTLALKCNLASGAAGAYLWGLDSAQDPTSFTGVTSGTTIAETLTESNGQTMTTATAGTLSVVLDTNSPGYKIVSAGSTGVELARYKFSATNEDIDVKQVALEITSAASNTPVDLVGRQVTLWTTDGVQVGTAVFPTGNYATSSAITDFRVPKNGSKVLVVKGDIAGISASGPLTASGDLLTVSYDADNESGTNGNYGTGVASGSNAVPSTTSDLAPSGARIMKAYPTLAHVALSSSEKVLQTGANKTLYKFKATAVDGDVALYKFTFQIGSSTVSATTSAYKVYAYTDSAFSQPDTTFSSDGSLVVDAPAQACDTACTNLQIDLSVLFQKVSGTNVTYVIPEGATRYFRLDATVASVETGTGSETVTVQLDGDAAYSVNANTLMEVASGVDGDTNDDFLWSPISTTTQNTINDLDFTNGYLLQGLPTVNMTAESIVSIN
jgi:hypothetical protein